jgi:hypothetical protein
MSADLGSEVSTAVGQMIGGPIAGNGAVVPAQVEPEAGAGTPPVAEVPKAPAGPVTQVQAAVIETIGQVAPTRRLALRALSVPEMVVCVAAILLWIILAGAGILISTEDCFLAFDGEHHPDAWTVARSWWTFLTCYTYTNVGLLCCLSALIGAIGQNAHIDGSGTAGAQDDPRTFYLAAVIRGFFIYLVILAGLVFVGDMTDKEHMSITIEQYLKLAGAVSVLSFAIGYSPTLFPTFFNRVVLFSSTRTGAGGENVPTPPRVGANP